MKRHVPLVFAFASFLFLSSPQLGLAATVKVSAPNGGECFTLANTITITWEKSSDVDHVAIALRQDSEAPPLTYLNAPSAWNIAHPVYGISSSWVPSIAATGVAYKIWIEAHNPSHGGLAMDSSDSPFGFATHCEATGTTYGGTTTGTLPAAPSSLTASIAASGKDMALTWIDNSSNEAEFRIFRRLTGGSWFEVARLGANTTSFTEFGLAVGTYEYHVNACNASGCSSDSNAVTAAVGGAVAGTTLETTTQPTSGQFIASAFVEGVVRDAAGQLVAGAGVHAFKEDFSVSAGAMTDANGFFRVGVVEGTYLVEVFPPFERTDLIRPPQLKVSVASGETKTVNLQFTSGVKTIVGSVTFTNGNVITDAEVGAYSSETFSWVSTFTDATGRYALRVSGGKWKLGIRPKDPATAKWSWSGLFEEVEFAKDASSEVKTVNFTSVVLPDSTLTVRTLDEKGSVVADAGVVVDIVSAKQPLIEPSPSTQFRKSDAQGIASFPLLRGTYYVRGYLPPEKGYLNPEEQSIAISSGQVLEIRLVFRRPDAVTSVTATGITKFEDATPISAFVWGWSEKGRYVQTNSAADGKFTFQLSVNDRWHMGAGAIRDNFPYKSADIIIDVGEAPPAIELVLSKVGEEPLPAPVSVARSVTDEIVAQSTDGAKVTVPPNAAALSGTVTVEVKPTLEAPSQAAAEVVGTVYEVSVRDAQGSLITQLRQEAEITLPYDESTLKAQGIGEDALIPSFFDETAGVWVKIDNFTIDKDKNVVIARFTHLTRFALVAAADITPPAAPADAKAVALGGGKIAISWKNPVRDFNNAKVYRSEKAGELGKLIAGEVTGQEFSDGAVVDGVTYYYIVRAVDPAGNESSNMNQVSVVAVGTSAAPVAAKVPLPPGQATKLEILRTLTAGSSGDDVRSLQEFLLNEGVYPQGLITGFFGNLTKQAVIRFQEKYTSDILAPAGLTKGSGVVGPATRRKLNELLAAPPKEKPALPPGQALKLEILNDLRVSSSGEDVKNLQEFLLKEGVYPQGLITGFFGDLTKQAVIRFQEKYASEILTPVGLPAGSGFVGPATRKKINELLAK